MTQAADPYHQYGNRAKIMCALLVNVQQQMRMHFSGGKTRYELPLGDVMLCLQNNSIGTFVKVLTCQRNGKNKSQVAGLEKSS